MKYLVLLLLLLNTAAIAQTTFDPLTIGVGARALGMGRAYVAVAEDGDTIFTNPAGLGEIDAFQFTTMSGTILEDLDYSIFGMVYPIGDKGAIGFGYAAARITGIEIRDTSGTLLNRAGFENAVLFASYGRKLTDKLSLGVNLKYFKQDGTNVNDGDGTGTNLDIGLLQRGLGFLSIGAVGKNILSSNKIRYKNGEEEALPKVLKVGARMYLLGEKFRSARFSPIELTLVMDADLNLESSEPMTTHVGAEFSPTPGFTLRGGIEESVGTVGFSFRFAGVGFHYAFHPYGEIGSETHYFSLSFDERGWPPEGLPDTFLSME